MSKFLLDCDTGLDDAVAIAYADRHVDLIGITTVHGNVGVEATTRNTLAICELLGLDVPVAKGVGEPWNQPRIHAPAVHGEGGLGDTSLPEPSGTPVDAHAVDFIIDNARAHSGELILAATGPLTNVATAIRKEPRLRDWLQGISLMGGSTAGGNVTPAAEFNIFADPEAAAAVFTSGIPIRMFGLNVTTQVSLSAADAVALRKNGNHVSEMYAELLTSLVGNLNRMFGLETASLHDPCVFVPYVREDLFSFTETHVEVVLERGPARGMTICDLRPGRPGAYPGADSGAENPGRANVSVATSVRGQETVRHILDVFR